MMSIYGAGINQLYWSGVPSKVRLMIHHRRPNIELVSPLYAFDGVISYIPPNQRVYAGFTAQSDFNLNSTWGEPIGILMYELKKQFNNDAIYSRNEATCTQLVMIWKVNNAKEFYVVSRIVEHDKDRIWNRDELMRLAKYHYLYNLQNGPVEHTYLIYDDTVLRVRTNGTRQADCYKLELIISEASVKDDTERPQYIGLNGIMPQLVMQMNVYNQCSDFKLIYISEFKNNIYWNKEPDVEVDAGNMTSASLISTRATFDGGLTYQLKRKRVKSDDQLESTSTLLFITWKYEGYKMFHVRLGLIEHDKQVKWNGYKLREYYRRYVNQFGTYTGPIRDKWLLHDGTILAIRLELYFTQRNWVLNTTISAGVKDEYIRRPVWLYPKMFAKDTLNITIRDLHSGLELVSPVYCSNNAICHVSPNQQTDTGTIIETSFGIVSKQNDVKGALLYKLQRKHTKTGDQLNSSITYTKNTAENVYFLVVWDVENERDEFRVCLLECTDDNFTWDEDKLWALCHQYNDQLFKNYDYTALIWLVHGNVVMKTRYNVTYGSECKLDIIISEVVREYFMEVPMKIDPKSLSMQPTFKLVIHNQCLNVDLVSPVYVTSDGLECHRPPTYKVYTEDIMRSAFINNLSNASYGVLIYELQTRLPRRSTETGEDTLNDVDLLVIWKLPESKELRADVLLVKHTKEFTWNEDKLRQLYYENRSRLKGCNGTTSNTWFMDDNMSLRTTFRAKDLKGNPELSIFIFEEKKSDYAMKPFCIDLTSLALHSLISLSIHNRCQDIKLISPIYFMHGGKWRAALDQEISVNVTMQNRIEFDAKQDILKGALVYKIQHIEADQDESTHNWLLIAWHSEYTSGSHVRALVVEYNKQLDGDRLRRLYEKRWDSLRAQDNATGGSWSLNDTTKLVTTVNVTNGGYKWDISISEETK